LLVALVVSISMLGLTGLQSAGAAAKPDHLAIISITDADGNELPHAAGSFVAPTGKTVKYTVQTQDSSNQAAPVSGSVTVYLTEDGAGHFTTSPQGTIRSRGTQVTISATYALADPTARQEYNVPVTASATDLQPATDTGNFITDFNSFNDLAPGSFISAGGPPKKKGKGGGGTAVVSSASSTTDPESLCTATSTQPTCIIIDANNGVNGYVVLTLSDCAGFDGLGSGDCRSLLVSFLADINGLYSNADPLTMIIKCDATTCGGGGVSSYTISIDLNNGAPLTDSPPCDSTNPDVVPDGKKFCTAYNNSHRDNAQDLVMYFQLASLDITGRIH
jgi:hypothetical protein